MNEQHLSLRGMRARYGFRGICRLLIDVVYTKLFVSRKARIIRRPAYIRGRQFISFGTGLTTGVALRLDAFPLHPERGPCLKFGRNVQLNDYIHIAAVDSVSIGDNVLIASKVFIADHNHGSYGADDEHDSPEMPPAQRALRSAPVKIEENVWIGEFVSILPGVTIGRGSIIGTMSVVNKDIPPHCVAAGVPARVIKTFDFASGQWRRTPDRAVPIAPS